MDLLQYWKPILSAVLVLGYAAFLLQPLSQLVYVSRQHPDLAEFNINQAAIAPLNFARWLGLRLLVLLPLIGIQLIGLQ